MILILKIRFGSAIGCVWPKLYYVSFKLPSLLFVVMKLCSLKQSEDEKSISISMFLLNLKFRSTISYSADPRLRLPEKMMLIINKQFMC